MADLTCSRHDGTRTRLYAELAGRWALLASDDRAHRWQSKVTAQLGDRAVSLTPLDWAGRHTDEIWLIRPDAHLAWRGRADSSGPQDWLRRAGITA